MFFFCLHCFSVMMIFHRHLISLSKLYSNGMEGLNRLATQPLFEYRFVKLLN